MIMSEFPPRYPGRDMSKSSQESAYCNQKESNTSFSSACIEININTGVMDGIFGQKILPDIVLGVAASVVVIIFAGGLYSKSRSLYTNLGPCSKHWKKFVANVFTPDNIPEKIEISIYQYTQVQYL